MKKIMLMAFAAGLFAFTSCSSDDDGGSSSDCHTCTISLGALDNVTEYCDNGDGTVTATDEDGNETTLDLEGNSYSDFISAQEQLGDCENS
ncbi:hypothetical protein [Mesonia algae]|nr:hypothetical protein [Mesonia algae]